MKIVNIIGGLGNQMFQYAFAVALRKKHPDEAVYVDTQHYRNAFIKKYHGNNFYHNGYEIDKVFPRAGIKAAGAWDLMKVSFNENGARLDIDVADQNRKINVDGKGWLKFHDNGLVLTQKFPDIAPADAAPGEAEIQVYIDARKSFVEIEAQGPYTELQPGEKLDWTVRWYLAEE